MLPEFLLAPARLLAGWLIKRTKADRMDGKNRVLNAQVRALNPGKADAVYQYHLEKLTGVIGLAMLVLPAVVLVFILSIKPETVQDGRLERLPDKDQIILLYCRTGRRAEDAAAYLAKKGYTNIYEIGGIIDWKGETVTGNET